MARGKGTEEEVSWHMYGGWYWQAKPFDFLKIS